MVSGVSGRNGRKDLPLVGLTTSSPEQETVMLHRPPMVENSALENQLHLKLFFSFFAVSFPATHDDDGIDSL